MRFFEAMERRHMMSSLSMEIGMNLDNVNDYTPNWIFTDVFQSSRSWISHAGAIDGPARLSPAKTKMLPNSSFKKFWAKFLEPINPPGNSHGVKYRLSGEQRPFTMPSRAGEHNVQIAQHILSTSM